MYMQSDLKNTDRKMAATISIAAISEWTFITILQTAFCAANAYSTVTDFAKLRGWSTSVPLIKATWYDNNCSGRV